MIQRIIKRYSSRFVVTIEQVSIQGDHVHLLVRAPHRSKFHHFFRVVAGQVAQHLQKDGFLKPFYQRTVTDTPSGMAKGTGLWKHRPFSRVVRGHRAYVIVRNYIQLNEKEALGQIRYQKNRLRGLSSSDWTKLWS